MSKTNPTNTATDEVTPEQPAAADPSIGEEAQGPDPAPETSRVEALEQEVAGLRDQLLRRRAEFDNYRRRVERDRAHADEGGQSAPAEDGGVAHGKAEVPLFCRSGGDGAIH